MLLAQAPASLEPTLRKQVLDVHFKRCRELHEGSERRRPLARQDVGQVAARHTAEVGELIRRPSMLRGQLADPPNQRSMD